ncbi:MAG: hypothetical protein JNJ57_15460 [Saprospiraceae bacterium]|nr:hypothetical protein [Saprospiraceae bacterium]
MSGEEVILYSAATLGTLAFLLWYLYRYTKNCPKIEVTQQTISFGRDTYLWKEIKHIELVTVTSFRVFNPVPMPASVFILKTGKKHVLFEAFYSNLPEIKQFIQQHVLTPEHTRKDALGTNPLVDSGTPDLNVLDQEWETPETFAGNAFLSKQGLTTLGLSIFVLLGSLYIIWRRGFYRVGDVYHWILILILLIGFSFQMHYFQVSDRYLTIRMHNFFWVKKRFRLSDIQEIVIEPAENTNFANRMRIVFMDYSSKKYVAGSLNKTTWEALQRRLERAGISVHNML